MSNSSNSLKSLLQSIVKESVDIALSTPRPVTQASELQRQDDLARQLSTSDSQISSREVIVDEEEGEEAQEKKPDAEKEEKSTIDLDIPAEIKFQDIRKQIDQIRSGKSLKDPETKLELVDYYDNLDEPERIALYKFLVSISKVLTKDVEGDDLPALDQGRGKVVTKGKTKVHARDPDKKQIAKSAARSVKKQKQKKKVDRSTPESEFTPPIKVGESQDKHDVLIEILNSIV
jgi:hypothetical protein